MRPLPSPFDRIAAGLPAPIDVFGAELLNRRLLTKDLAFPIDERDAFGLRGLLPDRVLSIEEQLALEDEHLSRKADDLERYIGLAALQDRNATLFYRLLAERPEAYLPIVYTPTVGRACQDFSHILRRTRGMWITPADRERVPEVLRAAPYDDVRLVVVTDNERILGLGDQGAGGMGIPIGKLALYTAAAGIHPAVTLPVSLDVGTDNRGLLDDPLYIGFRAPRLRGAAYDALVEAFVVGLQQVWPDCLVQFEDFKGPNALRLLERYRERMPCFNDDVQGTAAVVVGGLLAALRHLGARWDDQRVVLAGSGAAGIGIARLIRLAMRTAGVDDDTVARAVVLVDSRGLVHAERTDLDPWKREQALSGAAAAAVGLELRTGHRPSEVDLTETIRRVRPTILIGATGVGGRFSEPMLRSMAQHVERPVVLVLSNPTSASEATPEQVLRWTDGRALVATGSPFPAVTLDAERFEIGQANNVFIFPGVGLGAIVAEARGLPDTVFLAAARTLADRVTQDRLDGGALYPPIGELREVSREIAVTVARTIIAAGLAGVAEGSDVEAEVAAATWWPAYAPYTPA